MTEAANTDIRKKQRQLVGIAIWAVLLALTLSAATYAWISSNLKNTNVTPVTYTITDQGLDLLIDADPNGQFSDAATLSVSDKVLFPISSSDLTHFFAATFQNPAGINLNYAECTNRVSDFALTGTFYLKGSRTPLNIFLLKDNMEITSDPQLLAALRLGFLFQREDGSVQTEIFALDDLGDTSGATSQRTTAEEGVVVAAGTNGNVWSYVPDPAISVNKYAMNYENNFPVILPGAQKIFTINANEIVTVTYFIYMEGCDPNCFKEAQISAAEMRFAFSATDQEG